MFYDSDYLWDRGCLSHLISAVLTILAILSLVIGTNKIWAWLLLVGDVINIILYIVYRRISKRKYYQEDSFWLRKDDDESNAGDGTEP